MRLILASNSPRRKELLAGFHIPFEVIPSRFEEAAAGLSAKDTALCFACGKAAEVAARFPEAYVLGADTVVSLGGEILGKPKDGEDAKRMLRALSGKTHSVFTGVCLTGRGVLLKETVETKVTFYPLSEEFIARYVESGSPLDKAGAYGIQDGALAESYQGSYTNVIGLPVETVGAFLKEVRLC